MGDGGMGVAPYLPIQSSRKPKVTPLTLLLCPRGRKGGAGGKMMKCRRPKKEKGLSFAEPQFKRGKASPMKG